VSPDVQGSPSTPLPRRRRLAAVELFSGAGGMALGFERAGFDLLAAVELEPIHLAAHERNFPLCEPVAADVSALTAKELKAAAVRGWVRRYGTGPRLDGIDCIFGGPSCQGFSVLGRMDPNDKRNQLVFEFVRLVLEVRPRFFVLENVPGLVSPAYKDVLEELTRRLRSGGYEVGEPWMLNAKDYGVPQERRRVFVVGARRGESLPARPARIAHRVTVAEALDDLPPLSRFTTLFERDVLDLSETQHERMLSKQSDYVRRTNGLRSKVGDLSDRRVWADPRRLTSVGLTVHSDAVLARLRQLAPGQRDEIGRLPKLNPHGQAPTLRAGTGRDHGSFTSARPVHHRSPRVISVREAARLHGFPDWFGFHRTRWHGFRQVGNSVPPPLAQAVASTLIKAAEVTPPRRRATVHLGADALLEMPLSRAADWYGLASELLPPDVRRSTISQVVGAAS
jgi:DNA (cytosine-5)-methyltransferase 1